MDAARFASWLAKVGAAEAARRIGVSESTVRKWKRSGVSPKFDEAVSRTVARSEAASKARRTQLVNREFAEGPARELPQPPQQRRGENLTPEQRRVTKDPALPTLTGRWDREKHTLDEFRRRTTWQELEPTDRWINIRMSPFFDVNQHYRVFRDTGGLEAMQEHVRQLFRDSGGSSIRLFVFWAYWYPNNPAYRRTPVLWKKRMTWQMMPPVSTSEASTLESAARLPEIAFARGGRIAEAGIDAQAETRDIWVLGYQVRVMDERPPRERREALLREPLNVPRRRRRR